MPKIYGYQGGMRKDVIKVYEIKFRRNIPSFNVTEIYVYQGGMRKNINKVYELNLKRTSRFPM